MMTELIIKNYRCFQDTEPARLVIGKGFTAFVGPNNAGKSSLLKFVYELRSLWRNAQDASIFVNIIKEGKERSVFGAPPHDVYDATEVFCDQNIRPIIIDVTFPDSPTNQYPYIKSMRFRCERENPAAWFVDTNIVPDATKLHYVGSSSPEGILVDGKNNSLIDASAAVSFFRSLHDSIYIGPFRNAINTGASKYFDVSVGTEFIKTWNDWKTGAIKNHNAAIGQVTEDIRRIFGYQNLEINASVDLNTLQVSVNNKPYKLREVGSGLAQFILVFGTVAIKRPSYILLDEPELNLHPSLQIDFMTSLAAYAKEGLIFATHSLGLARSIGDKIYSLRQSNGQSMCRQFDQTPNYAEFAGAMSFASYKELGFEKLLLVEGVTDVKTIQQFLRLIDKDHRVVVIPLGGDQLANGGVEHELEELTRITAPDNIAVLVDSERNGESSPPIETRLQFEQICKKLKFQVLLTHFRSIENYLTDRAVKEEMGSRYSGLQPYQRLKDLSLSWDKKENWRIARRMKWDELRLTDVGLFLDTL